MNLRSRRDIDDIDATLFDRDEAEERKRLREEQRALVDERRAQYVQQDAAAKVAADAGMAEANERARVAEYRAAGVFPPSGQRASLSLLLHLGWRIEEIGQGERVLVKPPSPEPWEGPRDRDSLPKAGGK